MKRSNCLRTRFVLLGIVAVIVFGGGRTKAVIIMSEPSSVGPVINDVTDVQNSDFSHDGLELYYSSARPGGYGRKDIWVAARETLNSPWQEPINLGPNVNSPGNELEPSISSDNLELYFVSWDDYILRVCTRPSKDAPWSTPIELGSPIGYDASSPDISADGLSLYFASERSDAYGNCDVWVATRATKGAPWGEPLNLGPNVNTSSDEWALSISADGLTLVFNRGLRAMWGTTRKSIDDDWGPAVRLPFNNPPGNFHSPTLSPDGSSLYFNVASTWGTLGANDIWQVKFIPIVDFNGDGIVDAADMHIMADNWHTNSTLCDIAPLPIGDGYVDVKDLHVLAEYLEPGDPTMIAHWKLNEAEGSIAYDFVGRYDGTLSGEPLWQPQGGQAGGALELDGIDDYVSVPFILNPANGSFSVFAWIKGGAPGQVVISQETPGVHWFSVDGQGNLMTELGSCGGRSPVPPLSSQALIADGDWHRVGFVWDGASRILYVDDVEVASDVQAALEPCEGGLYIGTGSARQPGTFFSGLIDDMRIYNRAVNL